MKQRTESAIWKTRQWKSPNCGSETKRQFKTPGSTSSITTPERVNNEIREEIKRYLETNKDKNTKSPKFLKVPNL